MDLSSLNLNKENITDILWQTYQKDYRNNWLVAFYFDSFDREKWMRSIWIIFHQSFSKFIFKHLNREKTLWYWRSRQYFSVLSMCFFQQNVYCSKNIISIIPSNNLNIYFRRELNFVIKSESEISFQHSDQWINWSFNIDVKKRQRRTLKSRSANNPTYEVSRPKEIIHVSKWSLIACLTVDLTEWATIVRGQCQPVLSRVKNNTLRKLTDSTAIYVHLGSQEIVTSEYQEWVNTCDAILDQGMTSISRW